MIFSDAIDRFSYLMLDLILQIIAICQSVFTHASEAQISCETYSVFIIQLSSRITLCKLM